MLDGRSIFHRAKSSLREDPASTETPSIDPRSQTRTYPATGAVASLERLIAHIEACALAVYSANDLPIRPGHYAKSRQGQGWRFLAETLTAEERWALIEANADDPTYLFGTLEDLGAKGCDPASPVGQASYVLKECRAARMACRAGSQQTSAQSLESAIRLGRKWAELEGTLTGTEESAKPVKPSAPPG